MLREILVPRQVERQIAGLPRKKVTRILDELEGFLTHPDSVKYNVRTVPGSSKPVPRYRMRSGNYRVVFSLMHDRLIMETISKKKDDMDE
jgi:mRNA-degrading endonuclease RelE of RelBE toxin-antitoxin system